MNLSAKIWLAASDEVEQLFAAEEKSFSNSRARYDVRREGDKTVFLIEANDSTALKAVVSSITGILTVYEKTKAIADEQRNPREDKSA